MSAFSHTCLRYRDSLGGRELRVVLVQGRCELALVAYSYNPTYLGD